MDFLQLRTALTNGTFVRFEVRPSTHSLVGVDNYLLRFFEQDGSFKDAVVKYNPETNEIFHPSIVPQPIEYPGSLEYQDMAVYPDPESVWRLEKYLQDMIGGPVIQEEDLLNVTALQWSAGKSFRDLQTLNLMFIQGFLPAAPYHGGPLDPETGLIHEEINLMNRLDMITVDSQPYEEFPEVDGPRTIQQYPWVSFLFPQRKSGSLEKLFAKHLTSAQIVLFDFSANRLQTIQDAQPQFKRTFGDRTDLPDAIYYYRGIDKIDFHSYYMENYDPEIGDNFDQMMRSQLVAYHIADGRKSNQIFADLAAFAKELI